MVPDKIRLRINIDIKTREDRFSTSTINKRPMSRSMALNNHWRDLTQGTIFR